MPAADPAVGPVPVGRDPVEYDRLRRRVLWSMPTGLFVVGSRSGDRWNLMTCNWAMQVATAPKLVAVSVEVGSVTAELIGEGGSFSVSVLPRSERSLIRRFVKPVDRVERDADGRAVLLQGEPVHEEAGGVPCLSAAAAWLVCAVRSTVRWEGPTDGTGAAHPASHLLFVGEVVDAGESVTGGVVDGGTPEPEQMLQMGDTRMHYGG